MVPRGVNVKLAKLWWNLGTWSTARASSTPPSYCQYSCTMDCLYLTSQPELTTVFVCDVLSPLSLSFQNIKDKKTQNEKLLWATFWNSDHHGDTFKVTWVACLMLKNKSSQFSSAMTNVEIVALWPECLRSTPPSLCLCPQWPTVACSDLICCQLPLNYLVFNLSSYISRPAGHGQYSFGGYETQAVYNMQYICMARVRNLMTIQP